MHLITRSRLALAAWFAGFSLCLCAADFAPPAMGPVAFRRDQVPLAAWTMAGLSRHLETIARSVPGGTAAQRQAAARALALAIALDTDNEEPRKLLDIYQNGGRAPAADAARLAESQARVWQLLAWLETPEAGPQGQALAFCLQDVMAVSDPGHPRAAALREAGEKGAWAGWVPGIRAYEHVEIATNPPPGDAKPEILDKPRDVPEIVLPKASVETVFRQRKGTGLPAQWAFAPASLGLRATRSQEGRDVPFSILIGPEGGSEQLAETARMIRSLLEKQQVKPPSGLRVHIRSGELARAIIEGKIPEISAAAAVLASTAVTGREPEAIIIGQVDASGAFKLPARFWDQLQALGSGNGRKLVLPAAAAAWLPAFLAMEKPGIFMDYEVLLADDFRQLLELCAKSQEGAAADAAVKFREIRARGEGQDLRTYVTNRFVRQRLEELVKAAPFHASASMLLLQGSANRPRELNRSVLAGELLRAIEPMEWISQLGYLDSNSKEAGEFNAIYKSCRLSVDGLERYVAKADMDLWESSRDITAALWKLSRAVSARGEYDVIQAEIQNAHADFTRLYRGAAEQLDAAAR